MTALDLLALLQRPADCARLDASGWDRIVRVAEANALLARLGHGVRDAGAWERIPGYARRRLESALLRADAHRRSVRWEVRRIAEALGSADLECVLLKGAAYVLADLPAGRGRTFEDVDILVRRSDLARAESALEVHGWVTGHRDAYDQRYYRRWMHELPPMHHVRRGSCVDVHHRLLPLTAPLSAGGEDVWEASVALDCWPGIRVPCDADLVIHSATHLFFDGALETGLRDLVDLDALLRDFDADPGFWPRLLERAEGMAVALPLADALHWCARLLGTPLPEGAHAFVARHSRRGPRGWLLRWLFGRALKPRHPLAAARLDGLAHGLLYVRSHRLRMPLRLVLPHLARKALRFHATPTAAT